MEIKNYRIQPFQSYDEMFDFLISLYTMFIPMNLNTTNNKTNLEYDMWRHVINFISEKIGHLKTGTDEEYEKYKCFKNKLLEIAKSYDVDKKFKIRSWRKFYRY